MFGKVFIEDIPGQKASMDEIKKWKNSTNVMWARDNLWSQCLFVLAVVDIIFDVNVLSTTLTGETITMNKLLEEKI